MTRFKQSLIRAERFRTNMRATIAILAVVAMISLKYPLAFLGFLIMGLAYAIYRIVKDRRKASVEPQ